MDNNKNDSFKSKMENMFDNAKDKFNSKTQKLRKSIRNNAKGVGTAAMLGVTLATGGLTGCANTAEPAPIEINLAEPTTIDLGSGIKLHNFFGEDADINYETMTTDVARYLDLGADYLLKSFDDFEKTFGDRLQARYFFNDYINNGKDQLNVAKLQIDKRNDFEPFIRTTANLGNDIIKSIIDNLKNNDERIQFCGQLSLLCTEAGEEGLKGITKNQSTKTKYNTEIDETIQWVNSKSAEPYSLTEIEDLFGVSTVQDPNANQKLPTQQNKKVNQQLLAYQISKKLNNVAPYLNPEITGADLTFVINGIANSSALYEPHQYLLGAGFHKDNEECEIKPATHSPAEMAKTYLESKYLIQKAPDTDRTM